MLRFVLAVILIAHGFAHLVGFVVPWRIATLDQMPYATAVLAGSVDIGHVGIRIVGIHWLATALAFAVCSIGILTRQAWWVPATAWASAFSLVLCVIGWPDARIGVFVNLALLALSLLGRHSELFLSQFAL